MKFPHDFHHGDWIPIWYSGPVNTSVPPFGCLSLANNLEPDTSGAYLSGGGQVLGNRVGMGGFYEAIEPSGQLSCEPELLVFNGPTRLVGGDIHPTARNTGHAKRDCSNFYADPDTYLSGDMMGPAASGFGLTRDAPYSAPFRFFSGGLIVKSGPKGMFSQVGESDSDVLPGEIIAVSSGSAHTHYTNYSAGKIALYACGIWDIFFSATVYGSTSGLTAARGDSLVVAMESDGGTVKKGSGLRLNDIQTDYDSLITRENIAFSSTISCQWGTQVWFYNASAVDLDLERICVLVRQVSTWRYPVT